MADGERSAKQYAEEKGGKEMKVIRKIPGQEPELAQMDNTLEALQEAVGGYIEVVTMAKNACIICNEEGRLRGLPYNITFLGERFVGPVLVVGVSGEDFCDVPEPEFLMDQIRKTMNL